MILRVHPLLPVYMLTSMMLVAIKVPHLKIEDKNFLIIDWKLASKFFKISTLERGKLEECNKKITLLHGCRRPRRVASCWG